MMFENIKTTLVQISAANENIWNTPSLVLGAIGGFFVWFLGGWDVLMQTFFTLAAIDIITGVIKSICHKRLSSKIYFRGFSKKALEILIICAAVALQNIMPNSTPLREITIMFFICNEGISILENTGEFIPFPSRFKEILLQLRDKSDEQNDKKK